MRKYVTVQDFASISLKGVKLDVVLEDKTLKELRLLDADGTIIIVKPGDSYSNALKVLVPAPPAMERRWFVEGKFVGIADVSEQFDDEGEARERLRVYERKTDQETGLSIVSREVLIDESKQDSKPRALAFADDAIPF